MLWKITQIMLKTVSVALNAWRVLFPQLAGKYFNVSTTYHHIPVKTFLFGRYATEAAYQKEYDNWARVTEIPNGIIIIF